jgi:hypothetical protein
VDNKKEDFGGKIKNIVSVTLKDFQFAHSAKSKYDVLE